MQSLTDEEPSRFTCLEFMNRSLLDRNQFRTLDQKKSQPSERLAKVETLMLPARINLATHHPMLSTQFHVVCAFVLFLSLPVMTSQTAETPPILTKSELGSTRNAHSFGNTMLCGQPTAAEFAEAKKHGMKPAITLREKNEIDWDEAAELCELGIKFYQVGFRAPNSLTTAIRKKTVRSWVIPNARPSCSTALRPIAWASFGLHTAY